MTETEAQEAMPAEVRRGKSEDLEERLVAEVRSPATIWKSSGPLDFDGDIDLDVEGDRAIVSIDGGDDLPNSSVGAARCRRAPGVDRLAVHQKTGEREPVDAGHRQLAAPAPR